MSETQISAAPPPEPPPAGSGQTPAGPPTPEDRHPTRHSLDRSYFLRLGINALTFLAVGILLFALLGLMQRFGWITARGPAGPAADAAPGAVYTCPMHPQIRQPTPGSCPICGMPLEPAAADGIGDQDEYAVNIQPAARRLANIRTAPVVSKTVEKTVESIGRIDIDESRQAKIAAYVAGRIERLFADYTGIDVRRGDHLAVIYSPQLYAAQVEYLESRRTLQAMQGAALEPARRSQERLIDSARRRLAELGMTPDQLDELDRTETAQSRVTIYAPSGGTVIEKLLVEGQYVDVGEPIYRIADLSTVWLMLQIFPEDAALMRFGQRVEVETQSLPGTIFEGRIAFIDPVVDRGTRTVDVRIEMLNEARRLRPGDYARARVSVPLGEQGEVYDAELAGKWISPMHPQIIREEPGECPICGMDLVPTSRYGFAEEPVPRAEMLVVPRRAVLMTGNVSLVYVETDPGRFEIRPIRLGPLLRDEAVVLDGVAEGEEVAVSGNFLIDSQMQLAGKPSLIDPTRAIERPPPAGPLDLPSGPPEQLAGTAGEDLERLYEAYAALAATLAADEVPSEAQVEAVQSTAARLAQSEAPPPVREEAGNIAEHSAHLHHRSISEAREQFRTVSRSILHLAAQVRGEQATNPLIHYYCSMVPDGGADWLQTDEPPANPYWGSRMLRCAQHEEQLPPPGEAAAEAPQSDLPHTDAPQTEPPAETQQAASQPASPTT